MPRVTELLYLERDTAVPLSACALCPRRQNLTGSTNAWPDFEWQPFGAVTEAEFRSVLQATYMGSLDMPELEGTRTLDDILESHRATGRFVAERWRLGRIPGKPEAASVLLMAEVPGRDVWEVIYLGLTPAARGHGLGRAVLQHALELAGATSLGWSWPSIVVTHPPRGSTSPPASLPATVAPSTWRSYRSARTESSTHWRFSNQRKYCSILKREFRTGWLGCRRQPWLLAAGGDETRLASLARSAGRCRRISPCLR